MRVDTKRIVEMLDPEHHSLDLMVEALAKDVLDARGALIHADAVIDNAYRHLVSCELEKASDLLKSAISQRKKRRETLGV